MKKGLSVILLLVAIVIIIAHGAIHHHHNISENIEIKSDSHSDDHGHRDNDDHQNHKNHFPPHQHVISDGDFLTGRNTISLIKVVKDSHQNFDKFSTLVNNLNGNTYFTCFIRVIKKPLSSYPFIISFNSTRGSPSIS